MSNTLIDSKFEYSLWNICQVSTWKEDIVSGKYLSRKYSLIQFDTDLLSHMLPLKNSEAEKTGF